MGREWPRAFVWGQRGRPAGPAGGAGQWAALPPALRLGRGGFTGGGPSGQARYVLNAGAVTLRHALPECAACRAATNCTRQQLRGALRRTGGGHRRRVRAAWWRAWQPRWRVLDCDALARKRRSEAPDCNLSGWVLSLFGRPLFNNHVTILYLTTSAPHTHLHLCTVYTRTNLFVVPYCSMFVL